MTPESQLRLAEIAARWNKVELRMKQIELLRREALYATINELRYTGRKVADVLILVAEGDKDSAAIERDLIVAENYLINADHDLTDAAIMFVGLQVQRVFERHGKKKAVECIPKFDELFAFLEEAKAIVVESRGDRRNRIASYTRLAELHVPKLIELYGELIKHSELAVADPATRRRFQITTAFVVLFGLVSFGLNIWNVFFAPRLSLEQIKTAIQEVLREDR
jgi:hypothetical protein